MKKLNKFKRGDKHPVKSGLVFFRYNRGREYWVTPKRLKEESAKKEVIEKRNRNKPHNVLHRRIYMRKYQKKPERKAYRTDYYKQPHVRQRYKDKYASDPELRKKISDYSKTPEAKRSQKRSRTKRKNQIKEYNLNYDHAAARRRRIEKDPTCLDREAGKLREYRKKNPEKARQWEREGLKRNPNLRLGKAIRGRIRSSLLQRGGLKKRYSTELLIGCSIHALRIYLEAQFVEGMDWSNYGTAWHLDHRVPIALFDISQPDQQKIAFNFENLSPLWAKDNLKKNDKIEVDGKLVQARKIRTVIPFPAVKSA